MKKQSLGLIETWGYVPAIEAADAGTKAANVNFLGYEITRVALVTVRFVGEVAAVQAAVTAGEQAAKNVGKVVSVHVIPRPDPQIRIEPLYQPPSDENKLYTPHKKEEVEAKPEPPPPKKKGTKAKPELPPLTKSKEKKIKRAKPIRKGRKTK
jgi:microcompartment protein CcmL/EutN